MSLTLKTFSLFVNLKVITFVDLKTHIISSHLPIRVFVVYVECLKSHFFHDNIQFGQYSDHSIFKLSNFVNQPGMKIPRRHQVRNALTA